MDHEAGVCHTLPAGGPRSAARVGVLATGAVSNVTRPVTWQLRGRRISYRERRRCRGTICLCSLLRGSFLSSVRLFPVPRPGRVSSGVDPSVHPVHFRQSFGPVRVPVAVAAFAFARRARHDVNHKGAVQDAHKQYRSNPQRGPKRIHSPTESRALGTRRDAKRRARSVG